MEDFYLSKQINKNKTISIIVGKIITEYDIKKAYYNAVKFIDESILVKNNITEENYKVEIGKLVAKDSSLYTKISEVIVKWFNVFIKENKIKSSNFIETTPDSILLYNIIPRKLVFYNGLLTFVNKNSDYTSMYSLKNKTILYNSKTDTIRIKGISKPLVDESPFVNNFLKKYLKRIENDFSIGQQRIINTLIEFRSEYINSTDYNIYREMEEDNMLNILIEESVYLKNINRGMESKINKTKNYFEYVLPIIKLVYFNRKF